MAEKSRLSFNSAENLEQIVHLVEAGKLESGL
jgi:hypothetical protein